MDATVLTLILSAVGAVCGLAALIVSLRTLRVVRGLRTPPAAKHSMYYDPSLGIYVDKLDDLKYAPHADSKTTDSAK